MAAPSPTALRAWLPEVGAAQAFEALANSVPDAAVFAVDADRTVVFWSDGAQKLLGFKAQEAVGAHCLKVNRCTQCMRGCGIADHRAVSQVPLQLHREDGSIVRLRKSGRAFFDQDGAFAGGVEVLVPDPTDSLPTLDPGIDREFHGIVTADDGMRRVFRLVEQVAQTDTPVLVRGDSGTGKELIARAVHAESPRRDGPFVAVNCATLTSTLLESELFGHERGAFTGAVSQRRGVFEQADGGTLFLDEVAELPANVQAKLLRVLETGEVTRVGGEGCLSVDVRMVAATHKSLRRQVGAGRFREDLMYRLRVVPIRLPPLRDRRHDIALLAQHFVAKLSVRGPRVVESIRPEAMRVMLQWRWPGNVRELRNAVAFAFAVGRGPTIGVEDLPPEMTGQLPLHNVESEPERSRRIGDAPGTDTRDYTLLLMRGQSDDEQRRRIQAALQRANQHLGVAAELLGVSRATLYRKRRRLDIA